MRTLLTRPVLSLLLLAACDCGTGPQHDTVSGTYTLHTIGGEPVPLQFYFTNSSSYSVSGGEIVLQPNRTFTLTTRQRSRIGTPGEPGAIIDTLPRVKTGTYVTSGNSLQLTATDGATESVTLQGSTLTRSDQGKGGSANLVPWVYTR
jgi:hypothetical protein